MGHAFEVAKASSVTLDIDSSLVPLLPDVLDLIKRGMLTRGDKNNRVYVGTTVRIASGVSAEMQSALFDPQTAGGLLVSISSDKASQFVDEVPDAVVIGSVREKGEYLIEVS
jgi:selenide,water dikinase